MGFAGDDDDEQEPGDDDVDGVCARSQLADAFTQMGAACEQDVLAAIAAASALTDDRRCQCFTKVNLETAAELTCKSQAWKELTVAEEFAVCVASAPTLAAEVCTSSEIEEAESLMPASCHKVLKQALAKGIALDDSTRCTCFMHLNPLAAKKVKCKITEDQQFFGGRVCAVCGCGVN